MRGFGAPAQERKTCHVARAVASRLNRKCGLGVSFDLVTGRLALGRETAASVFAAILLEALAREGRREACLRCSVRPGGAAVSADGVGMLVLVPSSSGAGHELEASSIGIAEETLLAGIVPVYRPARVRPTAVRAGEGVVGLIADGRLTVLALLSTELD